MDNKHILKILDNGIKILLIPIKKIKLVDIQIALNVGADNETHVDKKNTDIESSHFLEHMFSTYTSNKFPDARKVTSMLKQYGITNNAMVDSNTSKYDLKLHKKHLKFILNLIYHTYSDFKVDTKIFKQEKTSIEEEIKNILDDIWIDLDEKIYKELYPNHIRGLSQKVNLENVKKMQPNDLIKFYKKFYIPKNTTLIIAGDFNIKETMDKCISLFSRIKNNQHNNITRGISFVQQSPKILFAKNTKSLSYNLYIIFRVPYTYFDKQYYNNYALSNILANDLESILLVELRSKHGLIYSLHYDVNLDENHKSLSNITINTQLDEKNLLKTIKIILDILYDMSKKLISKKYYNKYKTDIEMSMLEDKAFKNSEEFINLYGRNVIFNKEIESSKDMFKKLGGVNVEEIKKEAGKIYKKNNMIIGYSGRKNYDKQIEKLIDNCNL